VPSREASGRYAIASPHELASQVGADVLHGGGNAVDAALAAAAVLAVVNPNQCSIGGDLIALVGLPDGTAHVLNASGRAPRDVDLDALRSRYTHMPVDGALAVTVPGVVDGWQALARLWGTRPMSAALAPAVTLARDGVPVSEGLARDVSREAARIAADPGLSEMLVREGTVLGPGATLFQPRLADTLEAIAADGPEAFYAGEVAASLVRLLRDNGSAMTVEDFARHHSTLEEPLAARFGPEEYLASGGNSQGGFFLAGLRVIDVLRERLERTLDPLRADAGPLARILARLAAERDLRLGDPGEGGAAGRWTASILDSPTAAERLADDIGAGAATLSPTTMPKPLGDTVAIVAADRSGQWACLIQSVFHAFGSGLLDPGTGVLLHNRGAAFDLTPGSAGALAGGRRPPHTLMPVLVRDATTGRIVGAHGTMGGRAQPQIHTHLALNVALGRGLYESVASPRWVVGAMEAGKVGAPVVQCETDVPEEAQQALAGLGLPTEILGRHDDGTGHAQVVRAALNGAGAPTGRVSAASDPRADGAALTDET
jgi:gamma-glutamyltranspeptidase/glutathione hydrolase